MRTIILSSLLTSILAAGPIGGVAVLVKNSPITMQEISQEMKQSGMDATRSADTLIRKKLEQLEASEKKITVSSAEVQEELNRMAAQNNLSMDQFLDAMKTVRGLSNDELKKKVEESLKGQKLYNSIAFAKMAQPTAEEEAEYYQLHLNDFSIPESFEVTTYTSNSKEALEAKMADPMRLVEAVTSKDEVIPYGNINPQLAQLLNKIEAGSFGPVLPHPNGGFMAFYMTEKKNVITENLDSVRPQISNAIMNDKRNQVLNDYFTRLRLNADIKIIRLP